MKKIHSVRDGLRALDAAELVCLLGDLGVIAFVAPSSDPSDYEADARYSVLLSASPDFVHASWFAFGWAGARRARALPYGREPTKFYPRDRDELGHDAIEGSCSVLPSKVSVTIGEPLRFSGHGDFDLETGEDEGEETAG